MNITDNNNDQALIVSITPYFLEKGVFWFQEHLGEILESAKTQVFFQDNILFFKKGKEYRFSEIVRKLDEMGYEKVFTVSDPGEFSQKGGVIEILPINMMQSVRLDFLGNTLETIAIIETKINNEEKARSILQKKLKSQKLFSDLKTIKPGDYLVHLDHGVAKFTGIVPMPSIKSGHTRILDEVGKKISDQDFYKLEYAHSDVLFVPVGLERKLSRYVGFTDPLVSRLGSSLWQKTKRQIKEDVEKLAKDLLALYANKEIVVRKPYQIDAELMEQFKAGFLHQETPDQLQAIEDITADLQQQKPMDRIVCGDVGFGKTEIAMRASLLAASNNYQTAIICPTTILANQHFLNFKERFSAIGGSASGGNNALIRVAQLSRLQSKTEQKKIISQIAEGKIDIVIGTHRVLSNDITFKNLQLLILDDEQRFGVKQKEKLRQGRPALDLLSLSATPIPRTIYLALSSFKNISLMQTPPLGCSAISTHIIPYQKSVIKTAISFELARGGQVYFLHNRVASIDKTTKNLCKFLPGAKISAIHGRMTEHQILKVMKDFTAKKTDILVATTIIENGIDLPNVNTIIIEDASRLGLAQAYQIRGRVG